MSCDIIDQINFFFVKKYLVVVNVFFSRKKFKLYDDWLDVSQSTWQVQK